MVRCARFCQVHVASLAELTTARKQIGSLQAEIAAYRSVDAVPAVKHLQASRMAGLGASARGPLSTIGARQLGVRNGNGNGSEALAASTAGPVQKKPILAPHHLR